MPDTLGDPSQDRRLNSWKEIAAFFGKDERTVRRWEASRGLPVRRVPGGSRNSVFAYASELEQWLDGALAEPAVPVPAVPAVPTPPAALPRRGILLGFGIGAAAVIVGLGAGRLAFSLLPSPVPAPPTEADELYALGSYLWEKRTPESLREARTVFEKVVTLHPTFARGYVGLANTYNLLREYSLMPASEAYAAAVDAGRRAVELDPSDGEAMCSLAFAEFYGLRQITTGLARFVEARRLEPGSSRVHHWYGNALLHLGRFEEGLAEIDEAQRLEPGSRAIWSSKGLALYCVGRVDEAIALLTDLSRREPDFLSPIAYLAYIYLARNDYPAWLETMAQAGKLRGDPSRVVVAAAGQHGLAEGGFHGMLNAMISEERRQVEAGTTIIYNLARVEALAGDWRSAVASLRDSLNAGEEMVMGLNIDPAFASIRTNAAFRGFAGEFGLPIV